MVLLTAGQIADRIQKDWWSWVQKQTGKFPISVRVQQFKALITPFLEGGYDARDVKAAIRTMFENGETFTKAGIERRLDGYPRKSRYAKPKSHDQRMASIPYDPVTGAML